MNKKLEIFKCKHCGNIVEVVHPAVGQLVCCGEPMELLVENTVEASKEKHLPVIEKTAEGYKVKIGSAPHPMESVHYIEWIELVADGKAYRQFLNPGAIPEAAFCISGAASFSARAYCNLHGLWKS